MKKENNALDFDDLLSETRRLLLTDKDTREYLSSRFRYVLVDEFQDIDKDQYALADILPGYHKNLFVVENPLYGNATYVFDNNWEEFSKLSKSDVINNNLMKYRYEHRLGWESNIDNLLR